MMRDLPPTRGLQTQGRVLLALGTVAFIIIGLGMPAFLLLAFQCPRGC